MQERLLQRLQRGVLPLVEVGEALGFFAKVVNHRDYGSLFWNRRNIEHHFLCSRYVEMFLRRADNLSENKLLTEGRVEKCGEEMWIHLFARPDNYQVAAI